MTTLPPEIKFGKVVGRWALAVADTAAGEDEYPDVSFPTGKVTFKRLDVNTVLLDTLQNDGTFIGIASKDVEAELGPDGELRLAGKSVGGVWLAVGSWRVTPVIADSNWVAFNIVVEETHTALAPLDLLAWSPIIETPTVVLVASIETALRAEAAADRAETAAAALDTLILADLTDVDVTGIADGDSLVYDLATGKWKLVSLSSTYVPQSMFKPAPLVMPIVANTDPETPLGAWCGEGAFAYGIEFTVAEQSTVGVFLPQSSPPMANYGDGDWEIYVVPLLPDGELEQAPVFNLCFPTIEAQMNVSPGTYLIFAVHWSPLDVLGSEVDLSGLVASINGLMPVSARYEIGRTPTGDLFALPASNYEISHVEGIDTTASGGASHAEGHSATASEYASHAEGIDTTASGFASHAEGNSTTASGFASHAEGIDTTASGYASHAGGAYAVAARPFEFAQGGSKVQWSSVPLGAISGASGGFVLPLTGTAISRITATVIARKTDYSVAASWSVEALVVCSSGSARRLVGTPSVTKTFSDAGASSWTVAATLPAANQLNIGFSGATSDVRWVVNATIVEENSR